MIKRITAGLLIATGAIHLGLAFVGQSSNYVVVALFGALYAYFGLRAFLTKGKVMWPFIGAIIACSIGFFLGTVNALMQGFATSTTVLLLIDIAIIALAIKATRPEKLKL